MKRILLITTMYPDPLRHNTPVCHYFALEWVKMGYDVLVINYRSMFPELYTYVAKIFPKLAERFIGNSAEMDRNNSIIQHEVDGITVYSIPIFKYIPHGKYTKATINKKVKEIMQILKDRKFKPDAIIGHFYNPQLEIVGKLGEIFSDAHTCVSLHEYGSTIQSLLKNNANSVLSKIETIGFRSFPIKESFEMIYGNKHRSLLCFSGVSQQFIDTPSARSEASFTKPLSKFIYVGQFIHRKFPQVVAESLKEVYGNKEYHLTYVGKQELVFDKVMSYVKSNSLSDKVRFINHVPREEIIKFYDDAECFIMISTAEVFGLVYLEAMSRGCITIAAKNEGMQGIIQNGVNGFLCEAGNKAELCSILVGINELSPKERRQISENAVETARELSDYYVAKNYIENIFK